MSMKVARPRRTKTPACRKYRTLANGSRFVLLAEPDVEYVKICDAFALNNDTGKELIPSLFDKVRFKGFVNGYYPLHNA